MQPNQLINSYLKVAIYSRVLELGQQKDIQLFFDELGKEEIVPVVHQPFLAQMDGHIRLPANTETFATSNDLSSEIDFFVSLGGASSFVFLSFAVNDKLPGDASSNISVSFIE